MPTYPRSVADVLDDTIRFKPAAVTALYKFKASRPWRGTSEQRAAKLMQLNYELALAYNMTTPVLRIGAIACYNRGTHTITLLPNLSVVTYLHEFAHALKGSSEHDACRWSINLFRKVFPEQFAKLEWDGHMLVRRRRRP